MNEQPASSLDPQSASLVPWYRRAGLDIQEFSANGIRTFAVVEGRRDTFPAVFLHGFPGGAFLWEYVIAALGRRRLVIAPDFPGWGRSVSRYAAELPRPTPEWSLAWLDGVLAAQHTERADIVAHGTGAWIALEFLARDPSRVRRLSLISLRLWSGNDGGFRLPQLLGGHAQWTGERVQRWLDEHGALHETRRERTAQQFITERNAEAPPPVHKEREFGERFADYRRALADFRGAIQIIWGENDRAQPAVSTEELVVTLDRPEVHRIADAGHYPMLDQPQAVTPVVREFLED